MTEIENKTSPVRSKIPTHSGDNMWVELMNAPQGLHTVRSKIPTHSGYDICRAMHSTLNHIAYLRHAACQALSFFYLYAVPTGQEPFVNQTTNDIIKAHGGRIEIKSITGKGTTCIIQLPKSGL